MDFTRLVTLTTKDENNDEFQFLSEKLETSGLNGLLAEKRKQEEAKKMEEAAEHILALGKEVHRRLICSRDTVRALRADEAKELKRMSQLEMLFDYSVSNMQFNNIVFALRAGEPHRISRDYDWFLDKFISEIPDDFKKSFAEKRKQKKKK